jgi:hypothetical protein
MALLAAVLQQVLIEDDRLQDAPKLAEPLRDMWERSSEGENRIQLAKAFDQMPDSQRQVFVNAVFDTFKDRFVEHAREYNRMPKSQRVHYVDNLIDRMEVERRSVAGLNGGGPDGGQGVNVAQSFAKTSRSTPPSLPKENTLRLSRAPK